MRRVLPKVLPRVIALGIALASTGCMEAWSPRRYLATDPQDTCGSWDLECMQGDAHGTYGCGPSGCGTPVRQPTRVAK